MPELRQRHGIQGYHLEGGARKGQSLRGLCTHHAQLSLQYPLMVGHASYEAMERVDTHFLELDDS